MKLTVGSFEVDVKAKKYYSKNFSQADTVSFLMELALAAYDAAIFNEGQGFQNIAAANREAASDIRNFLIENKHI